MRNNFDVKRKGAIMKFMFLVISMFSLNLRAEESRVISIREPIPFNIKIVGEIEEKIEKSRFPVQDKKSTLTFKTKDVKAVIFNPRIPFKLNAPQLKPSYSQPHVPKVLKD